LSIQQALLDNAYTLETPEGVDLTVELAGPIVRTLAFTIDLCVRMLIMFVFAIVVLLLGLNNLGTALYLLAMFVIEWLYPVLFEVLRRGQTPGKKAMGISVINDDLTPVSLGASLTRNLLRFADFLPSMYTIGYITMSINPHFKRLGDIAAGTIVIYSKIDTKHDLDDIDEAAEIPPFELTEDEQSAIVEFTVRKESLSDSRQEELANIISEELPYNDRERISRLRGVGAWLLGSRN